MITRMLQMIAHRKPLKNTGARLMYLHCVIHTKVFIRFHAVDVPDALKWYIEFKHERFKGATINRGRRTYSYAYGAWIKPDVKEMEE